MKKKKTVFQQNSFEFIIFDVSYKEKAVIFFDVDMKTVILVIEAPTVASRFIDSRKNILIPIRIDA